MPPSKRILQTCLIRARDNRKTKPPSQYASLIRLNVLNNLRYLRQWRQMNPPLNQYCLVLLPSKEATLAQLWDAKKVFSTVCTFRTRYQTRGGLPSKLRLNIRGGTTWKKQKKSPCLSHHHIISWSGCLAHSESLLFSIYFWCDFVGLQDFEIVGNPGDISMNAHVCT